MREILLTQGRIALVDDTDYDWLNQWKWCANKGRYTYYAMRRAGTTNAMMHRIILNAPDGIEVDHINSNGLDNRKTNLRLCPHSENHFHAKLRIDNQTGFKGVSFKCLRPKRSYIARIQVNNKEFHIGCYQTVKAAARAYDRAALKHHGEFALTNKMLGLL